MINYVGRIRSLTPPGGSWMTLLLKVAFDRVSGGVCLSTPLGGQCFGRAPLPTASLIGQWVKNPPAVQETPRFDSWVGKIRWRRDRPPTPVLWPGEFRGLYMGLQRVGPDRVAFILPTSLGQTPHSHRPCAFACQSTLHWTGILGVHQYPWRSLVVGIGMSDSCTSEP